MKTSVRWLLVTIRLAALLVLAYCAFIYIQAEAYQEYEQRTFAKALAIRESAARESVARESAILPVSRSPVPPPPLTHNHVAPKLRSEIGRIEIPRLQLSTMILEGDEGPELRLGAGHVPGTAMPGDPGNVVIAAHRDTFFRPLRNIAMNDRIELTTLNGSFQYIVDSVKLINPDDTKVLQPTPGESLTLVTCYPFYYVGPAPKRFVVHARKVSAGQNLANNATANPRLPLRSADPAAR